MHRVMWGLGSLMLGPVLARGLQMPSPCLLEKPWRARRCLHGSAGRQHSWVHLVPGAGGSGVPACADVSWAQSHQGLELEARGGGNEAGRLVFRRKGEVREGRWKGRESEAQTASCFAKLKIDFSAVLFKDEPVLCAAILA